MEITTEQIAKQIKDLIDRNISNIKHDDEKWKEHYQMIVEDLESEIKMTEELIEDFTESKLSINLIEQEGYLRCLKTMVNRFRDWEGYINKYENR
jgi:hypothetical protein